jgi:hypothetical protein
MGFVLPQRQKPYSGEYQSDEGGDDTVAGEAYTTALDEGGEGYKHRLRFKRCYPQRRTSIPPLYPYILL